MPTVLVGVADTFHAAVVGDRLLDARVLVVTRPTEASRWAGAVVVAPEGPEAPGVLRVDGVAVVGAADQGVALEAAAGLPDPIRLVAVPASTYRKKEARAAEVAAEKAGRLLRVIPVREGGEGLYEATNEHGIPLAVVCRIDPSFPSPASLPAPVQES